MLDQLTGEMRDTVTSTDPVARPPLPKQEEPINGVPVGFAECPLPLTLPQPDLMAQAGPNTYNAPASLTSGRTASNYPLLDEPIETAIAPARTQSSGLLLLDTQPPGWWSFKGLHLWGTA